YRRLPAPSCARDERTILVHAAAVERPDEKPRARPASRPAGSLALAGVAGACVGLTWGALGTAPGPADIGGHGAVLAGAGRPGLALLFALRRWPGGRGQVALLCTLAILQRAPAWLSAPAHSDDVYRYLWDGRVQRAGLDPYRYPPDAIELAPLRDADWA